MPSVIPGLPPAPPLVPPLSSSSSSPSTSQPVIARQPRRKVFTDADLAPWFRSEAYAHLQGTILRLTHAVVGRPNGDATFESEATVTLVSFLCRARERVAEVPLQTTPQRFGNKAFRDWLATVEAAEPELQGALLALAPDLSDALRAAIGPELQFHLLASFGSAQRLDYGTGHELSFLAFLTCLLRVRVFAEEDEPALVLRVFAEYIEVVREAQRVFRLEPAGSKGVWGLDDHQHLVYLFGAAQLVGHPTLRPSSILTPASVTSQAPSYLFFSSIQHIYTLKRGPFAEHSPLLHQIATTVPSFAKVAKGLWEMYRAEVLAKVPVVQHCRFGDLALRWVDAEDGTELPSSGAGRADDEAEDLAAADMVDDSGPMITPAPWALGAAGTIAGTVRPLPPPTRLGASTTATATFAPTSSSSSSSSVSAVSAAFARRQHPSTFPLPPTPQRTSFQPPALFPPRTRPETTVAEQGGAAAGSSPFGVLPAVGLGDGLARSGRRAGGGAEEGGREGGTGAPWAV